MKHFFLNWKSKQSLIISQLIKIATQCSLGLGLGLVLVLVLVLGLGLGVISPVNVQQTSVR